MALTTTRIAHQRRDQRGKKIFADNITRHGGRQCLHRRAADDDTCLIRARQALTTPAAHAARDAAALEQARAARLSTTTACRRHVSLRWHIRPAPGAAGQKRSADGFAFGMPGAAFGAERPATRRNA